MIQYKHTQRIYITTKEDQTCTARHLHFQMIDAQLLKIVNTNFYKLTWY